MNSPRNLRKFAALIFSSSFLCTLVVSGASVPALGQQSAQAPAIPSTGFAGLDQYRASRIAVYTDDFGQLARYRDADAALKSPAPGESRVVFFGDSITDIWHLDEYFPGKPYINRGIGGQTTPQMLVRFRQDVIELHPKLVVVLAGTNDIAGNTGPMRLEDIEANYASLAELARAHEISLIYSSVLPPRFLRVALAGQNSGTEPLAEGLLCLEWLPVSRLLQLYGRRQGFSEKRSLR
jgi:hypothetical protein